MKVKVKSRLFSPQAVMIMFSLAIFQLWGIRQVPFHPDESALLNETSDLERLLENPLSLAWYPGQPDTLQNTLRLYTAPLPKYILGFSRLVAGCGWKDVPDDWLWSENWDTNLAQHAYPSDCALMAGRVASTLLVIASLPFL
jgi:hypothetical protein